MNEGLVTDTHPLIHYFCDRGRRLSRKARAAFEDAVCRGSKAIYVPAPALWEVSILIEEGKIKLDVPFGDWVDALFKCPMVLSQPFDAVTVQHCHGLRFHDDPFDRAIVATALQLGLPLITNDAVLHEKKPCLLYWD